MQKKEIISCYQCYQFKFSGERNSQNGNNKRGQCNECISVLSFTVKSYSLKVMLKTLFVFFIRLSLKAFY